MAQLVGESMAVIALGALTGWLFAFVIAMDVIPGAAIELPIFAGVPIVLLTIAAGACRLPVHRAACRDPMIALRHE